MNRSAYLMWASLALACGKPLLKPEPAPTQLELGDFRRAYVGEWEVEFALDSARDPAARKGSWIPARDSSDRATGKLEVKDSLLGPENEWLAAKLDIDFAPLLGRPMSCLEPSTSGLLVLEERDSVYLGFTRAFDCGFSGRAPQGIDTLSGAWEEASIAGPVARGRFWMRRVRRSRGAA